jgi:hypothetical protein
MTKASEVHAKECAALSRLGKENFEDTKEARLAVRMCCMQVGLVWVSSSSLYDVSTLLTLGSHNIRLGGHAPPVSCQTMRAIASTANEKASTYQYYPAVVPSLFPRLPPLKAEGGGAQTLCMVVWRILIPWTMS